MRLLVIVVLLCMTSCGSLGTVVAPPSASPSSPLVQLAADYAVWEAQNPTGDYLTEVLVPRALDQAGITQAVDNPKQALQAWATGTPVTGESALLTLWFVNRIDGLQNEEFDEVNIVVAKMLQELSSR